MRPAFEGAEAGMSCRSSAPEVMMGVRVERAEWRVEVVERQARSVARREPTSASMCRCCRWCSAARERTSTSFWSNAEREA